MMSHDFTSPRQLPTDHVFGGPAMRQPRPPQGGKRPQAPKKKERRSGSTRVIALEASVGLHLAIFLALMAIPAMQPAPQVAEKPAAIIPIEVAFVPTPVEPAVVTAPKAPPKEAPAPDPQSVERPTPPRPQQATTVKRDRPKPAVQAVKPAPKPQQKAVEKPKAPDLQALLDARQSRGKPQEDTRLAQLREQARAGAQTAPETPGAGQPHGDPVTSNSGLTGALAGRQVLAKVQPLYPKDMERLGEEGDVRVRVFVAPSGGVSRVELVSSSGRSAFDRSAIAAVRQWSFSPQPDAGEQYGEITLHFKLQ